MSTETKEGPVITAEYLTANHPKIVKAIKGQGFEEGLKSGREEGAKAERERIKEVHGANGNGHDKLVAEMMFDGKTTGTEAKARLYDADTALKEKKRLEREEDAKELNDVTQVEPGDTGVSSETKREKLVQDYMSTKGVDYRTAVLAVSREHPELYRGR